MNDNGFCVAGPSHRRQAILLLEQNLASLKDRKASPEDIEHAGLRRSCAQYVDAHPTYAKSLLARKELAYFRRKRFP